MRINRALAALAVGATAVALSACGSDSSSSGTGSEDTKSDQKLALVSPAPLSSNAFLRLGKDGIEQAGEKLGASTQVLESNDPSSRTQNVDAAIAGGAKVIVLLGFEFADIVVQKAEQNPSIRFIIVDTCVERAPANVSCIIFRSEEGVYLLGVEAAMLTRANHVGVIGAQDTPFIHQSFTDSFVNAAKKTKPGLKVDVLFVGGDNPYNDPARTRDLASTLSDRGADHIYAPAAEGQLAAFKEAVSAGFFAYGTDVNHCPEAPGHIVDNIEKRTDAAIVLGIENALKAKPEPLLSLGLKDGAVSVTGLADDVAATECVIAEHADVLSKVKEARDGIIAGSIDVTAAG